MTTENAIAQAREAFGRQAWGAAFAGLTDADHETPLDLADLERLAISAHMLGRINERTDALERAHQQAVRAGDLSAAVRCAFWLGFGPIQQGEMARGGGWLARAGRLLEEGDQDLVEQGYLLLPAALRSLGGGDVAGAFETFERIATIAGRFGDADLTTLSRLGRGQCLVGMGQADRGVAFMDEAMVAVSAGEVSPMVVGIVYCAAIEACQALFDLRRAQEWTAALTRWCESQPDLVPYRGRCLVYRTELMVFHGSWEDAFDEARRARDWLAGPPPEPAIGEALYQQAELHRLRGAFAEAEAAYREAATWGRRPEPGLAQLRLAQGAWMPQSPPSVERLTRTRTRWHDRACSGRRSRSPWPRATSRRHVPRPRSCQPSPTRPVHRCCTRWPRGPMAPSAWRKVTRRVP